MYVFGYFAVDPAANRGDKAGCAARERYSNNVQWRADQQADRIIG